jgi:hypothetical protein
VADDVISIAAFKIRGSRILTSQAFQAVVRPTTSMEPSAMSFDISRLAIRHGSARGKTMRGGFTFCSPQKRAASA